MTQALDFETFFAVSMDLLVIRDAEYRIVKVNQAWERVLGYRMDELEGQPMLSFVHPDDIPATDAQMQRAATERDVDGFVNRYRQRDGRYRHLEWRAHQHGDLVYGVGRDVTERLAIEAEMAQARAAAEAASTAKSEFLANMSHEIRTPLNGVIGVAGALARTELSASQREMVDLILTSGQTLERVVSDVLEFSKIEAGQLELEMKPFDLRPEIDGLLDLFRARAAEKGLTFTIAFEKCAQGWFYGDVVRIKQVLGNLVSNAVKFTTHGEVGVRIGAGDLDGDDAVLTLEVRDTGIGFDESFAHRLFQRFSQADGSITRRFGGTGLGLSISQALVEMMGGDIRASSTPGRGSVFEVRLPLPRRRDVVGGAAADACDPGLALEALGAREGGALRVLLAEDHAVNQRVVELILGPVGAGLTKAETGEAALRAFMAEEFDLVLMDMQMPVMDGLAATRAIRDFEAARPDRVRTPIVMLSANAMQQHKDEAIAAGADRHLAKPVTPAGLLGAVAGVLNLAG
ncbi:MAG: ATP-binding protein [Phenylobacterium sp.]|jgi:PAS domain S-box-containing protein|uniref:PAS domain-containing hybrid sensor histidine kinase/response regulator n=1 Tax=Phenylobacterium sp. TaxID=1871053 RepID=UPI002A3711D2|nr:ATP-binding protein [Phenylobacterium sp.]MDX9999169.1 ATP-binding protein [Phenylobacterium sp.]